MTFSGSGGLCERHVRALQGPPSPEVAVTIRFAVGIHHQEEASSLVSRIQHVEPCWWVEEILQEYLSPNYCSTVIEAIHRAVQDGSFPTLGVPF